MKKILKPSYSSMKFETKGLLERGEIYVCDNLQDIVVQVVFKDVTNGVEPHINILKSIVIDYINRQSRK
jgi:bacterioferritin (cytochrome b1)